MASVWATSGDFSISDESGKESNRSGVRFGDLTLRKDTVDDFFAKDFARNVDRLVLPSFFSGGNCRLLVVLRGAPAETEEDAS